MATFKDLNGKEWTVALDAPKIRAVRSSLKIDPVSSDGYESLYDDDVMLVDVLAVLCKDQFPPGITSDSFCAAVTGDATDRARDAFHEAVLDFSPSRKREVMRAVAAKVEKAREIATSEAMAQINSPEFEAKLIAATKQMAANAMQNALTQLENATSLPAL